MRISPAKSTGELWLRGLAGIAVGAVAGYFIFRWLLSHGYYGLALPGALIGYGAGWATQRTSKAMGIACGVFAFLFNLWLEATFYPFKADQSLSFFIRNLHELQSPTILMVVLGTVFAFWLGRGR